MGAGEGGAAAAASLPVTAAPLAASSPAAAPSPRALHPAPTPKPTLASAASYCTSTSRVVMPPSREPLEGPWLLVFREPSSALPSAEKIPVLRSFFFLQIV